MLEIALCTGIITKGPVINKAAAEDGNEREKIFNIGNK